MTPDNEKPETPAIEGIKCCDQEEWLYGGYKALSGYWSHIYICKGCKRLAIVAPLQTSGYREVTYGVAFLGRSDGCGKVELVPPVKTVRIHPQGKLRLEPVKLQEIGLDLIPKLEEALQGAVLDYIYEMAS